MKYRYSYVVKRSLIIFLFLFLAIGMAKAQFDVSFSHYWALQQYYNPASVGRESKLSINGAYNMSMVGFNNNPKTMYIGANMPFYTMKTFHGVGLSFLNDQIGLFKNQNFALQYSASFKMFTGRFRIGAQIGIITEAFDGSKLDLEDSGDLAFQSSQINGNKVDLGVGVYYMHPYWYAGLSAMHVNAPVVGLGEFNEIKIDRYYYFLGGYNIRLRNPFFRIKPSVILRTDLVAYKADITGRLEYNNDEKKMEFGASYSPGTSFTLLVGGDLHGMSLGYSYEVYTGGISFVNGSHELTIGYQMDMNFTKRGRNKHKSVRLL